MRTQENYFNFTTLFVIKNIDDCTLGRVYKVQGHCCAILWCHISDILHENCF